MATWGDPMLAACDDHLAELLGEAVPAGQARAAKVTHLDGPDDRFKCHCPDQAQWFVRVYLPDVDKAQG